MVFVESANRHAISGSRLISPFLKDRISSGSSGYIKALLVKVVSGCWAYINQVETELIITINITLLISVVFSQQALSIFIFPYLFQFFQAFAFGFRNKFECKNDQ